MHCLRFLWSFTLLQCCAAFDLPYINDAVYESGPLEAEKALIFTNTTCEECLCEYFANILSSRSMVVLNCRLDDTCEFYQEFTQNFRISPSTDERIYFLQKTFPTGKSCCMPDVSKVLLQLQQTEPTIFRISFAASAIGFDQENEQEAAVIGMFTNKVVFFDPVIMERLRSFTINGRMSLTLFRNSFYTSLDETPIITVSNSRTNNWLSNITHQSLTRVRKMIFLRNGSTLAVASQANNSIMIFEKSESSNHGYQFNSSIPHPFPDLTGLTKVNNTFFYASSSTDGQIAAFKYINRQWKSYSVVTGSGPTGSHITTDGCGRIWQVLSDSGLNIYDPNGTLLESWEMNLGGDNLFDIVLLPNYTLYLTKVYSGEVLRYDPQITC